MMNHYEVIGLGSAYETRLVTTGQIKKAFLLKALEVHPDKCPNDPNANSKFRELKSSFDVLVDESSREIYDNDLCHQRQRAPKREQAHEEPDLDNEERKREKQVARKREKARKAMERMAMADLEEEACYYNYTGGAGFMQHKTMSNLEDRRRERKSVLERKRARGGDYITLKDIENNIRRRTKLTEYFLWSEVTKNKFCSPMPKGQHQY